MSVRWKVLPVATSVAIEEGTVDEPFAYDPQNDMVYTKRAVFIEDDEPKSSTIDA